MSHVPTVLKSDRSVFDKMLPVDDNAKICEEVGGNSPLQLSSRTHIVKIEDKKVIAKNQF